MNLHNSSRELVDGTSDVRYAIVGIGCRFPGGVDRPEKYLNLLQSKTCAISEAPDGRWNSDHFYSPDPDVPQKSVTKWAGFVSGITEFDAEHFGISPREAEAMDPQQRLLLRVTWEAFEDAGIAPDKLAGSNTGVFVGISMNDYKALQTTVQPDADISHLATGMAMSVASNRISHKLDFHGPSLSIDTACSSSLVATDVACQALGKGDCDLAVVGGVNLLLDPAAFVSFSKARMVSPTGRVLTFDSRADGFVRAEGAGVVLLKRLSDAEAAGDHIYAVIVGTGVNSDGHTSTLTVPNALAQADLFREVCQKAEIAPEDIGYVEAHGTGTPVGDPIEAHAIGEVFGRSRQHGNPVLVGSVKSNIGHLEAGAGVAGLIKAALSLQHEQTFANPNFERINPAIPTDHLNIEVSAEPRAWPSGPSVRRAVVNSFGFGGTNACALLEEAPARQIPPAAKAPKRGWVVPLSAATETALVTLADNVCSDLENDKKISTFDAVATLAIDRAAMPERMAVIADSRPALIKRLRAFVDGSDDALREEQPPTIVTGRSSDAPKIAFAFSGQGSQWFGMAARLIKEDTIFLDALREVDTEIQEQSGWSVLEELARPRSLSRINQTKITQGCIFAVQAALHARLTEWGIKPDMIFGHSLGEIAAAYASGALSLGDAVKVLHWRSSLQSQTEGSGAIYAVGLSAEAMQKQLLDADEHEVEIAAINGDQMVTIAGRKAAVRGFIRKLRSTVGSDLFIGKIRMNFAPHSPEMDPIMERFIDGLSPLRPRATTIPLISTVTGELIDGTRLDAQYWWQNIRRTVMFQNAIQTSVEMEAGLYLEIGPDAPLSGLIATCTAEMGDAANVVFCQKRGQNDVLTLKTALARLFVLGARPDWSSVYPGAHHRLAIGRYPFECKEYWIDGGLAKNLMNRPAPHPLLGAPKDGPEPIWESTISLAEHPYLRDHKVNGSFIFPAAGYIEMMFAVYREVLGDGPIELSDIEFTKANFLDSEKSELFQTRYDPGRRRISIFSRPSDVVDEWDLRAFGTLVTAASEVADDPLPELPENPDHVLTGKSFYNQATELGYHYGKGFRGIKKVTIKDDLSWANLSFKKSKAASPYTIHPSMFDCILQISIAELFDREKTEKITKKSFEYIYLPRSLSRVRLERQLPGRFDVLVKKHTTNISRADLDKTAYDAKGRKLLKMEHYGAAAVHRSDVQEDTDGAVPRYYTDELVPSQLPVDSERTENGLWLIFADEGGIGIRVRQKLVRKGNKCITVNRGKAFSGINKGSCSIDPSVPGQFDTILAAAAKLGDPIMGTVFLWPCDYAHIEGGLSGKTLKSVAEKAVFPALDLVQALIENQLASALLLTTIGAKVAEQDLRREDFSSIAQAPLLGFARTVHSEYPAIRITALDLDAAEPSAAKLASHIVDEALAVEPERETEVVYRDGRRHVPRFAARGRAGLSPRTAPGLSPRGRHGFALEIDQPGNLDELHVAEADEKEPSTGEVSIDIHAVGLNFRDVMAAAGLLPPDAESEPAWQNLGMECSGIVHSVGPEIEDLKPGDQVIATSRGCFRSRMPFPERAVQKTPDGMSMVDAATLLTAFSTAYYGLVTQARLHKGERVLVHLGTGGVGLAAIQIARMVGAEIFATAGSPKKRAYLRELGIEHVMDSRSLDFIEDIRQITDGQGIHVVLNALSGEALQRGLEVLAPGGRFVEIGKRDIYADTALGLKIMRSNISFFAIDMARLNDDNPEVLKSVLTEIGDLIKAGTLHALPAETYSLNSAEDAFSRMAKGKHIGKLVVNIDPKEVLVDLSDEGDLKLDTTGSYLVTGGLGGYGLEVAVRLSERGAGIIYVMSRSGASTEDAKLGVKRIRKAGAKVVVVKGDVSSEADVDRVFAKVASAGHQLRGVLHAAVAYDDALLPQLNHDRMKTVFAPKVQGAWNLHKASAGLDLDHFVLFSSTSVPLGNVGQANYVAANMFMESLVRYRQAIALPGLCIAWGVMDIGEVARNPELKKLFKSTGAPPISVDTALAGLEIMMRKSNPCLSYAAIEWQKYATANSHVFAQPRMVGHAVVSRSTGDRQAFHETMAAPKAARPGIIARYLAESIAKVLKIEPDRIQPDTSLQDLGLDSLTAFQLKNRAEAEYGMNLQVSSFLQKPTVSKLSEVMMQALERGEGGTIEVSGRSESHAVTLSQRQNDILAAINAHQDSHCYLRSFETAGATHVSPPLDVKLIKEGIAGLVEEHPVISQCFPVKKGRTTIARCDVDKMVTCQDCRDLDDATFQAHLIETAMIPLDIAKGPLFEIKIFNRTDNSDVVLVRSHNAVMDGLSFMYAAEFVGGISFRTDTALMEVMRKSVHHADFTDWQQKFVSSPKGRTQLLYWQKKLNDAGPSLVLPYDQARTSDVPLRSASHVKLLPAGVTKHVKQVAASEGRSVFSVLMTAFALTMRAYSQGHDLLITTTASARSRSEFEGTIGPVSNTIVVKVPFAAADERECLYAVDNDMMDSLSHQDYPAGALKRDLGLAMTSQTALDQISFSQYLPERKDQQGNIGVLANLPGAGYSLGQAWGKSIVLPSRGVRRDLAVVVQDHDGKITVRFEYDAGLFDASTIEALVDRYISIASGFAADSHAKAVAVSEEPA